MTLTRCFLIALSFALTVSLVQCRKRPAGSQAPVVAAPSTPSAPALVSQPPAVVEGITWQRVANPGWTVEAPSGGDWEQSRGVPSEVSSTSLGITIMFQQQEDVPAEAAAQYTDSFIGVNQRDAPRYEVTARENGSIAGNPGVRVDGHFDNGDAFVTRDYLVFAGGSVYSMMARGPVARSQMLRSIADHVAASWRAR